MRIVMPLSFPRPLDERPASMSVCGVGSRALLRVLGYCNAWIGPGNECNQRKWKNSEEVSRPRVARREKLLKDPQDSSGDRHCTFAPVDCAIHHNWGAQF